MSELGAYAASAAKQMTRASQQGPLSRSPPSSGVNAALLVFSRKSLPAAQTPLGNQAGQSKAEDRRRVPKRGRPALHHRGVPAGEIARELSKLAGADEFAAGIAS